MTEVEHRCRVDLEAGVESCREVTDRLRAIAVCEQLGLRHDGLDVAVDRHLAGLDVRDEVER